jgi:hypothetical protein
MEGLMLLDLAQHQMTFPQLMVHLVAELGQLILPMVIDFVDVVVEQQSEEALAQQPLERLAASPLFLCLHHMRLRAYSEHLAFGPCQYVVITHLDLILVQA